MGEGKHRFVRSAVFACVDTFSAITLPDDAYPMITSLGEIGSEIEVNIEGLPFGVYRQVDGKLLGWLEWKVWQAEQRAKKSFITGVERGQLEEVKEFIKLLKSMTGIQAESVDHTYRRPVVRLFGHWEEIWNLVEV